MCGVYAATAYVKPKTIDKEPPMSSSYYEQKSTILSTQSIETKSSLGGSTLLRQSLINAARQNSQNSQNLEENREQMNRVDIVSSLKTRSISTSSNSHEISFNDSADRTVETRLSTHAHIMIDGQFKSN